MMFFFGAVSVILLIAVVTFLILPYIGRFFFVKNQSRFSFEETVNKIRRRCEEDEVWEIKQEKNFNKAYQEAGKGELPHRLLEFKVGNPDHSYRVNSVYPAVSTFMPAAIAVVEDTSGEVYIYRKNTGLMGLMFREPLRGIMGKEVPEELDRILREIIEV